MNIYGPLRGTTRISLLHLNEEKTESKNSITACYKMANLSVQVFSFILAFYISFSPFKFSFKYLFKFKTARNLVG